MRTSNIQKEFKPPLSPSKFKIDPYFFTSLSFSLQDYRHNRAIRMIYIKYNSQMDKNRCFTRGCSTAEGKLYYCCSETELFCYSCSKEICEKCKLKRTKPMKKVQVLEQNQGTICNCCQSKLEKQNSIQFKNCKHWLCKDCICKRAKMRISQGVWEKHSKKSLKCFCPTSCQEINVQDILDRYCFCCGQQANDKTKILKNGVKMREKCITTLLFGSSMKGGFQLEANQLSKQIMSRLIYTCENCSKIIGADEIGFEGEGREISCRECALKMDEILIRPSVSSKFSTPTPLMMERTYSWSEKSRPSLKIKMELCTCCGVFDDSGINLSDNNGKFLCFHCHSNIQTEKTEKMERDLGLIKLDLESKKREKDQQIMKKQMKKQQKRRQQQIQKKNQQTKDNNSKDNSYHEENKTNKMKLDWSKDIKYEQNSNERSFLEYSIHKQMEYRKAKQSQLDEAIRIRNRKQQQFKREMIQRKRIQANLMQQIAESIKKQNKIKNQLSQLTPTDKRVTSLKIDKKQAIKVKQMKVQVKRCSACDGLCTSDILSTYSEQLDISLCRPCYEKNIQYSQKAEADERLSSSFLKLKHAFSYEDRNDKIINDSYYSRSYSGRDDKFINKSQKDEYRESLVRDLKIRQNIPIQKLLKIKNDWKSILNNNREINEQQWQLASIAQQFPDEHDLCIHFPSGELENCSECGYYLAMNDIIKNKQNKVSCLRCFLACTAKSS